MPIDPRTLDPGLAQCDDGLWFSPRQPAAAVSYLAHGNAACLAVEDNSFWFRHRNRCIVALTEYFPVSGPFLDIGGGNGYVSRGLNAAGIPCVVVEPGPDGARAARARGLDPVVCARLEDLEIRQDSVGAAGLFDVLEHIEHQDDALRRVHTLLKPGGRLFLSVPAYPLLFSTDDQAAGHFRRYTLSGLRRVVVDAGFQVCFTSYLFAPLPPLIFLRRTLPSRLGRRGGAGRQPEESEHAPEGVAARALEWMLGWELTRIRAGRPLPFGASCLCVAVKPPQNLESQVKPPQNLESQVKPPQNLESQVKPPRNLESQVKPPRNLESQVKLNRACQSGQAVGMGSARYCFASRSAASV